MNKTSLQELNMYLKQLPAGEEAEKKTHSLYLTISQSNVLQHWTTIYAACNHHHITILLYASLLCNTISVINSRSEESTKLGAVQEVVNYTIPPCNRYALVQTLFTNMDQEVAKLI